MTQTRPVYRPPRPTNMNSGNENANSSMATVKEPIGNVVRASPVNPLHVGAHNHDVPPARGSMEKISNPGTYVRSSQYAMAPPPGTRSQGMVMGPEGPRPFRYQPQDGNLRVGGNMNQIYERQSSELYPVMYLHQPPRPYMSPSLHYPVGSTFVTSPWVANPVSYPYRNGAVRQPTVTPPKTSQAKDNTANAEFLSAVKSALGSISTTVSPNQPVSSGTAIPSTTLSSDSVPTVAIKPARTQPTPSESSLQFKLLIQSVVPKSSVEPEVAEKPSVISSKDSKDSFVAAISAAKMAIIPSKTRQPSEPIDTGITKEDKKSDKLSTVSSATTKSVSKTTTNDTNSDVASEFSLAIKNAASGSASESVSVALCPYGLMIDGRNVYTVDELLKIKENLHYDRQKIVKTLSKFRIAKEYKSRIVSGRSTFKSFDEKVRLGLLDKMKVFKHKVTRICNMLCESNFHQFVGDLSNITTRITSDMVEFLAKIIYEKASVEKAWSHVFAHFVLAVDSHFKKQQFLGDKHDELFRKQLLNLIEAGCARDLKKETEIDEMRKFSSRNPDEVDAVINEVAEIEEAYRKHLFGLTLFVTNLNYFGYLEDDYMIVLMDRFFGQLDTLGVELCCFFLTNVGSKLIKKDTTKQIYLNRLAELEKMIERDSKCVGYKARFSVMDLVSIKNGNFKKLPVPMEISSEKSAPTLTTPTNPTATPSSSSLRLSGNDYNSKGFVHRLEKKAIYFDTNNQNRRGSSSNYMSSSNTNHFDGGLKNDFFNQRQPNAKVLSSITNNRGSKATRARGAKGTSQLSRFKTYLNMNNESIDVNLDESQPPTTIEKPVTKTLLKKPFVDSLQPKTTSAVTNHDEVKTTKKSLPEKNNTHEIPIPQQKVSGLTELASLDNKSSSNIGAISQNVTTASTELSGPLPEPALQLISQLHSSSIDVSRLLIDITSLSLWDNPKILVDEVFKSYVSSSKGHYVFGVFLDSLVTRQKSVLPLVVPHLRALMENLVLDGLDEPILWNYFFLTVFPLISSGNLGLDDLCEMLTNTPDMDDTDQVILHMLDFTKKRLARFNVVKLARRHINSKCWGRISSQHADQPTVKEITSLMDVLMVDSNDQLLDWVDLFLNISVEADSVISSMKKFYDTQQTCLMDLAKSLYLNAIQGECFTNDLITLFSRRDPALMDRLFGENSSKVLLKTIASVLADFSYVPTGVLVDIGVPMLKTQHVDKDWLKEWRNGIDPDSSHGVSFAIFRILRSVE